jgi:SP family general alpha glucoside:H+ symporter-like MFS transporter
MLNPTAWNWGAKAGLFWVGMNVLNMTYAYFRLPETRGRTYGELDVLFEHGVSARAFAGTPVEQFPGHRDEMDEKAPAPALVH